MTRNLSFDSDFREWISDPLMRPLHSLWAKSNNRTRDQFECDVIWCCSCFDFVCSNARCGCCSIVLGFQVVQIKQVDCKTSTKIVNYKLKKFREIFGQLHTKNIKPRKSRCEASVKWKEVKSKSDEINELILEMKEGPKII